jgi:hypothetical protein
LTKGKKGGNGAHEKSKIKLVAMEMPEKEEIDFKYGSEGRKMSGR